MLREFWIEFGWKRRISGANALDVMMIVAVKLCLLAHNYTESLFALFACSDAETDTG